jgi:acylphosphatase
MDKRARNRHNEAMTVCKHVRYTGRVQGVGFRYTVQGLAEQFPVAGYVRNLPDGSVEVVAEGSADQVEAFLAAIDQRMAAYIRKRVVSDEAPGGHEGFRIRF